MITPALALTITVLGYSFAKPWLPEHVAIHVGPDGTGYGSAYRMLIFCLIIAVISFVVGGLTARGFFIADHWFQIEKSIVVGIEAFAFGVLGVAVGSLLSTIGIEENGASSASVGFGLLSFLLIFLLTAVLYTRVLPKAKFEELQRN